MTMAVTVTVSVAMAVMVPLVVVIGPRGRAVVLLPVPRRDLVVIDRHGEDRRRYVVDRDEPPRATEADRREPGALVVRVVAAAVVEVIVGKLRRVIDGRPRYDDQ